MHHNINYDQTKYRASDAARAIAKSGNYSVNGCGASGSAQWKVWLLTNLFGFNLYSCCFWHDLEFSVKEKSRKHFDESNDALDANLRLKLGSYKDHPELLRGWWRTWLYRNVKQYRRLIDFAIEELPSFYHAAITVGGYEAYLSGGNNG